jgi:hypothetical protein
VQLATLQALARYWTTEYDWRRCEVFTKLEIHSRHELSSALPSSESELAPA